MKRSGPLKRKTPMKRGAPRWYGNGLFDKTTNQRKGLRQVSQKRRRELKEYGERRLSFLSRQENRWCPVAASGVLPPLGKPQRIRTTDVHHRAGRNGKLLNDEQHWLSVSRAGHRWIHNNPAAARANNWLI